MMRASIESASMDVVNEASSILTCSHNVPDFLILNADQTPSRYALTGNINMELKGSNHVAIAGSDDKSLVESQSGEILPFHIIYQGKTAQCLPKDAKFPNGFCISYNETYWSNEAKTLQLLDDVIKPYVENVRSELDLPDQKALLIWDAFKAQSMYKCQKT